MNAEKYVIQEISCDADWFTLTGQDRIGTDLNIARIGKIPTPIPPVKPNQLLVSSFAPVFAYLCTRISIPIIF